MPKISGSTSNLHFTLLHRSGAAEEQKQVPLTIASFATPRLKSSSIERGRFAYCRASHASRSSPEYVTGLSVMFDREVLNALGRDGEGGGEID